MSRSTPGVAVAGYRANRDPRNPEVPTLAEIWQSRRFVWIHPETSTLAGQNRILDFYEIDFYESRDLDCYEILDSCQNMSESCQTLY